METSTPTPDRGRAPRVASPGAKRAPDLTAREQIGLAVLAVDRVRRGAVARMRRSRLMRWRYRSPSVDELLIAPPDLRVQDASFADEVADGGFGLVGMVAHLEGRSPFAIAPPSPEWLRELHGFGWLRHLDSARSIEVEEMARGLVREWIAKRRRHPACAWAPDIVGRRIISWLAHAGLLLDDVQRRPYSAIVRSLGEQVAYLSTSWSNAPDGYPRLLALTALVQANLCIAGRERELAEASALLDEELTRQVLPDGGHISRNPAVLVELLLDLLPLRQCFAAQSRQPTPALVDTIAGMLGMLRHLRLGDGLLARFNGMGASERDVLASVLAYDRRPPAPAEPVQSDYARLERGTTAVVVDVGGPPPLELAGAACAGCLSFELSAGSDALIVNVGAPGAADAARRAFSRATASHNTLSLNEQSSSKLIRNARLERQIGAPPIRHPDHVTSEVREADGAIEIEASHDGYVPQFGLIHARKLKLSADGLRLDGIDTLAGAKGVLRFSRDLPLAIHFHLHPDAQAEPGQSPEAVEILLDTGEHWRLTAEGATPSIEESVHLADASGSCPALQVVLRSVCYGEARVAWTLQRIAEGRPMDRAERQRRRTERSLRERLEEAGAGFASPDAGFEPRDNPSREAG